MHMHTCIYISPQLVHARLCNGAAASLPWKLLRTYLESCANIVQAVVSARVNDQEVDYSATIGETFGGLFGGRGGASWWTVPH